MRIVRFREYEQGWPSWGWVSEDRVGLIEGSPFSDFRREPASRPLSAVQLLAPVVPGKIICVARNYIAHAAEQDVDVPALPLLFSKPSSSLIGPGEAILIPPQSNLVEHEAELAVVIGQRARWVSPEDAPGCILGYTAANDVTARDLQRSDGQWTRGKGFDTFCPLGPWIDTHLDPSDVLVTCHVNGQLRQMGSTRDMIFPVAQLLAFVSSIMTLEPGDVLLTGTPPGIGPVRPGQTVSIVVGGVGRLDSPVV